MELVSSLFEGVIGLALAIGAGTLGMVLFPAFLVLAVLAGLACRRRIPHSFEITGLLAVFFGLFAWQAFFLFGYPSAPNERTLVVAGWEYTPQALRYLELNAILLGMTWETRSIELMSAFQARPELVWEGFGLNASRIVGGFLLCALVFLMAATVRWPGAKADRAPPQPSPPRDGESDFN